MRIALLAPTGYLTAELGGEPEPKRGLVTANRQAAGAWETWTVEKHGDGSFSLKSANGFYLCAEGGGNGVVYANRKEAKAWERFTAPGGKLEDAWALNILCADGTHYLSVETAGQHVVNASGAKTYFTVDVIDPDPVPVPELSPLKRDGTEIRTADGKRYVHDQATNYLLFQRFLEGQDIDALWYEGFGGYNVTFCMSIVPKQAGLRELRPENYDRFYERVAEFLDHAAGRHKRIEATLLCDCRTMGLDFAWQERHTEQMYDVLRSKTGHLCQLANEPENGPNGVEYARFKQPGGVFWSRGSSLAGQPCPLPPGDYSTAHLARQGGGAWLDAQSYYMIEGYEGYAGVHGPCIVNETRGASNTTNSDSRTTNADYFRKIAGAMRQWNGGTFHWEYGIHSEPCVSGTPQDTSRLAFLTGINGR